MNKRNLSSWHARGALLLPFALMLTVSACSNFSNTTKPTAAPTQTEVVIVQVMTSTPVPTATIATPSIQEATITPLATLTPIGAVGPAVGTSTPAAGGTGPASTPTRPAATAVKSPTARTTGTVAGATAAHTPTRAAATNPPAPAFTYGAIDVLTMPKNPRPNTDWVFEWNFADGAPVTPVNKADCYLVQLTSTGQPSGKIRTDSFDSCTWPTSFQIGNKVRFALNRPTFAGPNYASLLGGAEDSTYTIQFCINVVRKIGDADATHIKSQPLSPSACGVFTQET